MAGQVVGIFTSPKHSGELESRDSVMATEGVGLEGDRFYFDNSLQEKAKPGEITFIESEALEALERDYGIQLNHSATRRNILTKGVPLNHFINKEFKVGDAVVFGLVLCEPCRHLESLTQKGVMRGLIHRGGLRARIVKSGQISVGDAISE